MNPIAFQIGPLVFRWYGLLIMIGALAGAYVTTLEARRHGDDPDHVWNALLVCLILGLVGARLYHVFSSPQDSQIGLRYYLNHPAEIIAVWQGGLGIFGAITGGLLGLYLYTRYQKLSLLHWLDLAAPGLLLGQAIGRWGNFFNQELYGYPTTQPWGIPIDPAHRLPMFASLPIGTRFHPTFLYESLWNLMAFAILLFILHRFANRLLTGDGFLLYMILYPLGRIIVEQQRPDAWLTGGIPTAQLLSAAFIIISLALLVLRHKRQQPVAENQHRR
ncbi:MAG: prolipoprotein diacylglyceryl transferase [Chloroflexi bacterium]|nr:prolipoprotein diacylglyceryl transferase [Chloroflexota bacterium]